MTPRAAHNRRLVLQYDKGTASTASAAGTVKVMMLSPATIMCLLCFDLNMNYSRLCLEVVATVTKHCHGGLGEGSIFHTFSSPQCVENFDVF